MAINPYADLLAQEAENEARAPQPEGRDMYSNEATRGIARRQVGLRRAFGESAQALGEQLPDAIGDPLEAYGQDLVTRARNEERSRPELAARVPMFDEVQDLNSLTDWFLAKVGETLPDIGVGVGGAIAGGLVGGPVGAMAGAATALYPTHFGENVSEARDVAEAQGVEPQNLYRNAALSALPQAALDVAGPAAFLSRLIPREAGKRLLQRGVEGALYGAGTEAITELTQEAIGVKGSLEPSVPGYRMPDDEFYARLREAALAGGALGGMFGGIGGIAAPAINRNQRHQGIVASGAAGTTEAFTPGFDELPEEATASFRTPGDPSRVMFGQLQAGTREGLTVDQKEQMLRSVTDLELQGIPASQLRRLISQMAEFLDGVPTLQESDRRADIQLIQAFRRGQKLRHQPNYNLRSNARQLERQADDLGEVTEERDIGTVMAQAFEDAGYERPRAVRDSLLTEQETEPYAGLEEDFDPDNPYYGQTRPGEPEITTAFAYDPETGEIVRNLAEQALEERIRMERIRRRSRGIPSEETQARQLKELREKGIVRQPFVGPESLSETFEQQTIQDYPEPVPRKEMPGPEGPRGEGMETPIVSRPKRQTSAVEDAVTYDIENGPEGVLMSQPPGSVIKRTLSDAQVAARADRINRQLEERQPWSKVQEGRAAKGRKAKLPFKGFERSVLFRAKDGMYELDLVSMTNAINKMMLDTDFDEGAAAGGVRLERLRRSYMSGIASVMERFGIKTEDFLEDPTTSKDLVVFISSKEQGYKPVTVGDLFYGGSTPVVQKARKSEQKRRLGKKLRPEARKIVKQREKELAEEEGRVEEKVTDEQVNEQLSRMMDGIVYPKVDTDNTYYYVTDLPGELLKMQENAPVPAGLNVEFMTTATLKRLDLPDRARAVLTTVEAIGKNVDRVVADLNQRIRWMKEDGTLDFTPEVLEQVRTMAVIPSGVELKQLYRSLNTDYNAFLAGDVKPKAHEKVVNDAIEQLAAVTSSLRYFQQMIANNRFEAKRDRYLGKDIDPEYAGVIDDQIVMPDGKQALTAKGLQLTSQNRQRMDAMQLALDFVMNAEDGHITGAELQQALKDLTYYLGPITSGKSSNPSVWDMWEKYRKTAETPSLYAFISERMAGLRREQIRINSEEVSQRFTFTGNKKLPKEVLAKITADQDLRDQAGDDMYVRPAANARTQIVTKRDKNGFATEWKYVKNPTPFNNQYVFQQPYTRDLRFEDYYDRLRESIPNLERLSRMYAEPTRTNAQKKRLARIAASYYAEAGSPVKREENFEKALESMRRPDALKALNRYAKGSATPIDLLINRISYLHTKDPLPANLGKVIKDRFNNDPASRSLEVPPEKFMELVELFIEPLDTMQQYRQAQRDLWEATVRMINQDERSVVAESTRAGTRKGVISYETGSLADRLERANMPEYASFDPKGVWGIWSSKDEIVKVAKDYGNAKRRINELSADLHRRVLDYMDTKFKEVTQAEDPNQKFWELYNSYLDKKPAKEAFKKRTKSAAEDVQTSFAIKNSYVVNEEDSVKLAREKFKPWPDYDPAPPWAYPERSVQRRIDALAEADPDRTSTMLDLEREDFNDFSPSFVIMNERFDRGVGNALEGWYRSKFTDERVRGYAQKTLGKFQMAGGFAQQVAADTVKQEAKINPKTQKVFNRWVARTKLPSSVEVVSTKAMLPRIATRPELLRAFFGDNLHGLSWMDRKSNTVKIWIDPFLTGSMRREIMAHEFGHAIYKSSFRNISQPEARGVLDQFNKWLERHGKKTDFVASLIRSKKTPAAAAEYLSSFLGSSRIGEINAKEAKYLLDFEEWFSDEVSKTLVQRSGLTGVVRRFFQRIASAIRSLFGLQKTYLSVDHFVNSMKSRPRNVAVPVNVWDSLKSINKVHGISAAMSPGIEARIRQIVGTHNLQEFFTKKTDLESAMPWQENRDPTSSEIWAWFTNLHQTEADQNALSAVASWAFQALDAGQRETLVRAARTPAIQAQLRRELGSDDATRTRIQIPEIAAAEMYKLWLRGRIQIGDKTKGAFAKILQKARDIWGVMNDEEGGRELMIRLTEALPTLRNMAYTAPGSVGLPSPAQIQGFKQRMGPVMTKVTDIGRRTFVDAAETMRSFQVSAVDWIVDRFSNKTGQDYRGETFPDAKIRMVSRLRNEFIKPFEGKDAEFGAQVLEALHNRDKLAGMPQDVKDAYKHIQMTFKRVFNYLKAAGLELNHVNDYFPWVFETDYLADNREEFFDLLKQSKFEVALKKVGGVFSWNVITREIRRLQWLKDTKSPEFDVRAANNLVELEKFKKEWSAKLPKKTQDGQALATTSATVRNAWASMFEAATNHAVVKELLGKTTDTEGVITRIYNNIMRNSADDELDVDEPTYIPAFRSANVRVLNFVRHLGDVKDMDRLSAFFNKDLGLTLDTYINTAVKKAEYARRFGVDGEVIEKKFSEALDTYMVRLRDQYPDWTREQRQAKFDDFRETLDNYIHAMLGTHGHKTWLWLYQKFGWSGMIPNPLAPENQGKPISSGLQKLINTVMVYQNVRLLALATVSSLVDVLGIGVRTGDMRLAFQSFKSGIRSVWNETRGDPDLQVSLGKMLGIIDTNLTNEALGWEYGGVYMTGWQRKINEGFFKWTGLQWWTRSTRVMALHAGMRFLAYHKNLPKKESKRWLDQLGVTPEDIVLDENGDIKFQTVRDRRTASKESKEADDRVKHALFRFVDESILRPTAAYRPIWASDQHYALFFHLKSFMYTFHDRYVRRVIHEAEEGNYMPLLALTTFVPAMMAAEMLRDMIQHGGTAPRKEHWDAHDYIFNAFTRSGVPGITLVGFDAANDIEYGGVGFESWAGPTVQQLLNPDLVKALPANNLWRGWLPGG